MESLAQLRPVFFQILLMKFSYFEVGHQYDWNMLNHVQKILDAVNDFCPYFSDLPIVSLQFGTILKPDSIKEGDDIYFECIVEARPTASHIDWFINCLLYTSPSPRDLSTSRMPSSA